MTDPTATIVQVESDIANIDAADWDACANPVELPYNPFVSHTFLALLEETGCASPETGWMPQHLILCSGKDGDVDGVMPCYLKMHSRGEFIFDQGWAEAYERAGGRYYPKLLSAVPFSPVTGRRLLVPQVADADDRAGLLLAAAVQLTSKHGISSFHANFVTEHEWSMLGELGLLQRTDQQFHWENDAYATFDDFLTVLASRKRKTIRKERRQALENGIEVRWITGSNLGEEQWDAFYDFYTDTGDRKWGSPYLTRDFFSLLGERMSDDVLLMLAYRDDRPIAGALNMIGGDTLYGRYWGCVEDHPCLHFELCYYQAIDFAIEHGLKFVEAGAQGEHKLARGYVPKTMYSVHHLPDPNFRRAVADYLDNERSYVAETIEILGKHTPFKKRDPT